MGQWRNEHDIGLGEGIRSGVLFVREERTMADLYAGEFYINERGNLVKIEYDTDPQSPREWDNGTHFYTWESSYYHYYDRESPDRDLLWCGNEMGYRTPSMWEVLEDHLPEDYEDEYESFACAQHIKSHPYEWMWALEESGTDTDYIPQLTKYLNGLDGMWCRPVSKCCESYGIGDPGDDGIGLIYMDEEGQREMGTPDDRVMGLLEGDVLTYNDYVNGEVYGFIEYNRYGSIIDSCWGFYGNSHSGIEQEAIEDHTGKLHLCSFKSVDEYVDACEKSGITVHVVKTGRVVKTNSKQEVYV